jgi:hypothetical protein
MTDNCALLNVRESYSLHYCEEHKCYSTIKKEDNKFNENIYIFQFYKKRIFPEHIQHKCISVKNGNAIKIKALRRRNELS